MVLHIALESEDKVKVTSELLVSALQNVIVRFEEKKENVSIAEIAECAGSSYTTIREIKKGILKNLSAKKALDISQRLKGPTTIKDLLNFSLEESREYDFDYGHLSDYTIKDESFEDFISDERFSRIIWAAFSNDNITREEIIYNWGKEGEEKLNYLLDNGVLIEDNGLIKGDSEKAGADHNSGYKQLGIAYKLYDVKNRENYENWSSLQTNNVNSLFIKEMREELVNLFKKFNNKSTELKYRGNKRMFLGLIFDRYMNDYKL